MSQDPPIRKRWRDGDASDPLSQLFRKVDAPQLSAAQLEGLRDRIGHSAAAPSPSGLLPLGSAMATVAASAALGAVLGAMTPELRPPRPVDPRIEIPPDLSPPSPPALTEPLFMPMPDSTCTTDDPRSGTAGPAPPTEVQRRRRAPSRSRPEPPRPTPTPAPAVPASPERPDSLLDESRLLNTALSRWRNDKDSHAALELLNDYALHFPNGGLRPEADFLRINLLLTLERHQDALTLLDRDRLSDETPRAAELRIVRAELRTRFGRCADAIDDFSIALKSVRGALQERALYGRYLCRSQQGELGATRDLQDYLARFPRGRFHAEARKLLSEESRPPPRRTQ